MGAAQSSSDPTPPSSVASAKVRALEAQIRVLEVEAEAKRRHMLHEDAEANTRADRERRQALLWDTAGGLGALALFGVGIYLYRTYSMTSRVRRCKRALRKGLHGFASEIVPADVTRPFSEKFMLEVPYLYCVFGATGSGKTTLLQRVARQAALDGRPGIFLKMRSGKTSKDTTDPMVVFGNIAKAIDFPVPFVFAEVAAWAAARVIASGGKEVDQYIRDRSLLHSLLPRPRVADMANVLVTAVEEISREAKLKGGKVPVVIFDEVADLVRMDRLREAGGDVFFSAIAGAGVWLNVGSLLPVTWVLCSSATMWHRQLPSITGAARSRFIFVPEASTSEIETLAVAELGPRRDMLTATDFAHVCHHFGLRLRYWHQVLTAIQAGSSVQQAVRDVEYDLLAAIQQNGIVLLADAEVRAFLDKLIGLPGTVISEADAWRFFSADRKDMPQRLCEAQVLTWYENNLTFHSRFAYRWVCGQLNVPVQPFSAGKN